MKNFFALLAYVHFLLYLRTSALARPFFLPFIQSQFPRSYGRKMLDILQFARNQLQKNGCTSSCTIPTPRSQASLGEC